MTDRPQPRSVAEFTDQMAQHRETQSEALGRVLPQDLAERINETSQRTRQALGIGPDELALFFGEQTYGPGPQKVLGKRVLGRAAHLYAGTTSVELMASSDAIGSEPDLRAFKLPNVQNKVGFTVLNLLPGWKRAANRATDACESPTPEALASLRDTAYNLYNRGVAAPFLNRLSAVYEANPNYAKANTALLRDYETDLGIAGDILVHDSDIETLIAQNGGLEAIMALWPSFLAAAREHSVDGVRIPNDHEAPFYLYHECGGRMEVVIHTADPTRTDYETPLIADCQNCDHQEDTTVSEVLGSGRRLTFRAMARVAAHSLFLGDGHITGGGSIYNIPTEDAFKTLGIPYFPLMHMAKTDADGDRSGVFQYDSAVLSKKKAQQLPGYEAAKALVHEGGVSMADLEISTSPASVRAGIEAALASPGNFGPHSRVVVPKEQTENDS